MIDSHCHLNFPSIKKNINEIIINSQNNKINTILSINTNPDEFDDHLNLINNYEFVYLSYGLHPENVNNKIKFDVEKILLYVNFVFLQFPKYWLNPLYYLVKISLVF